jgi:hypothetical protein
VTSLLESAQQDAALEHHVAEASDGTTLIQLPPNPRCHTSTPELVYHACCCNTQVPLAAAAGHVTPAQHHPQAPLPPPPSRASGGLLWSALVMLGKLAALLLLAGGALVWWAQTNQVRCQAPAHTEHASCVWATAALNAFGMCSCSPWAPLLAGDCMLSRNR